MDDLLLREIHSVYGVSRRAVQGYEKMGLVAATGRNKMGYLLYNTEAQEKIKRIKQFQDLGFTLKEIKEIDKASNDEIKKALENRLNKLRREKQRIENMIAVAEELIRNL